MENAVLQREVIQREQMLAELLRQIVTAQETERQRIARELHDATGQSLTAVALGLSGIEAMLGQRSDDSSLRSLADQVHEIKSFSTNALGELRTIIADLRPPQLDDLGLVAALRWYLQAYERRRQITCRFDATGDEVALPIEYKTVPCSGCRSACIAWTWAPTLQNCSAPSTPAHRWKWVATRGSFGPTRFASWPPSR